MASHAANGEGNGSISKPNSTGQSASKAFAGNKMNEGVRRSVGNADDGSQRRAPQPKAWTTNINPITQQPHNNSQTNGAVLPAKTAQPRSVVPQDLNSSDRTTNDRQLWAFGNVMGLMATITAKSGEVFSGVFAGATAEPNESTVLFKMVRQVSNHSKEGMNGATDTYGDYIGVGPEHTLVFNMMDVIDVAIADVPNSPNPSTQNGTGQSFRIDSDISGSLATRERDLQRWEAPTENEVDMEKESIGDWDQFAANARFGGKSDYHEEIYTTAIDRSGPLYRMREIEAERKVREIEGDTAINPHIREERGLEVNDGDDEESRYSGVRRNGQNFTPLQSNLANRYTPPARRQASIAKPTTSGLADSATSTTTGSLDPAIISAQIARPSEPQRTEDVSQPQTTQSEAVPTQTETAPIKAANALAIEQPVKPTLPLAPAKFDTQKGTVGATENVEAAVLDSFRQFASAEKMKVQDNRRHRQSADKAVRFNDLMRFAKSFKLLTPVPSDLVPILAKDKSKQDEIVEKARRNAASLAADAPPGKTAVLTDQKPSRVSAARWEAEPVTPNKEHQARSSQAAQGSQISKDRPEASTLPQQPGRTQTDLFSRRLADTHRQHKSNMQPTAAPNPLPIQDARQIPSKPGASASGLSSPHRASGIQSPTSATSARFNVKATEFKPNPAANTFRPTNASSPKTGATTRSVSRAPSPNFWANKKLLPLSERQNIKELFDPLIHLKKEAKEVVHTGNKQWLSNGGIKPAYKTPPTWSQPPDGEEGTKYLDMWDQKPRPALPITPQQHSSPANVPFAHQHQLPPHLQNGPTGIPQVQTPMQVSHQLPGHQTYAQNQHHFDDHHMRPSASSSSVYPAPSPRMQNNNVAYPSPMNHSAQLAFGQPMGQYVLPVGPQQQGFRHFSGGPQMIPMQGPHLAPMMVQQPSAGGYMVHPQQLAMPYNPQMAMYPGAAQQPYGVPSGSNSGYPSPSRGAPMMMHQNSHQGQPVYMTPTQYGQPVYAQQPPAHMPPMRGGYASPNLHYSQSPYPQHHYPHQAHRTPSAGYSQLPQQPHHPQMMPQPVPPPIDLGEEAK